MARLRKWVEEGSPAAATALGICYFEGMGVEVNYLQAFKLLPPPAQRGLSIRRGELGCR